MLQTNAAKLLALELFAKTKAKARGKSEPSKPANGDRRWKWEAGRPASEQAAPSFGKPHQFRPISTSPTNPQITLPSAWINHFKPRFPEQTLSKRMDKDSNLVLKSVSGLFAPPPPSEVFILHTRGRKLPWVHGLNWQGSHLAFVYVSRSPST